MLLVLDVDVIAIAEVVAFAAASDVDEAVHGFRFSECFADVLLGFFLRDVSRDDQLDVEVLGILDFFLCHVLPFWRQR